MSDVTHQLYRQYGRQIYAYCLHHLGNREEAEDAVQTTFLNAFRGLQRGTVMRSEQAWLYKIAQNVCFARRASSGRRLRLEAPNDFEILQEIVPSKTGGETLELMGLDEALERMPENQRKAIVLREWQGLSYREIGEELGLSQGAVEMLIFRARRTLASALEQPAAERRTGRGRSGLNIGSLVTAIKSLFSGVAAIKMAAVAVTAAMVGTNAAHTVVLGFVRDLPSPHGTKTVRRSTAPVPATVVATPAPAPAPVRPAAQLVSLVRAPKKVAHASVARTALHGMSTGTAKLAIDGALGSADPQTASDSVATPAVPVAPTPEVEAAPAPPPATRAQTPKGGSSSTGRAPTGSTDKTSTGSIGMTSTGSGEAPSRRTGDDGWRHRGRTQSTVASDPPTDPSSGTDSSVTGPSQTDTTTTDTTTTTTTTTTMTPTDPSLGDARPAPAPADPTPPESSSSSSTAAGQGSTPTDGRNRGWPGHVVDQHGGDQHGGSDGGGGHGRGR